MKIPLITEGVVPLWDNGYYDGPLSGVVEYKGEKHYFDLLKEYDSEKLRKKVYRTFKLYKLTPKQLESMTYWHNEFCLHIGKHMTYSWDENKKSYTRDFKVNPGVSTLYWKEMFYERYEKDVNENGNIYATLDKSQIVGWLTYDVLMGKPHLEWRKIKK